MTFSSMPGLLEQLKELKASVDKNASDAKENSNDTDKSATTRSAAGILNRANDAAEVMIEDGRCIDAGNFLEAAYLGTADYLPDHEPVVPRSLLNLVIIKINTDPLKCFVYLNRCHNLMKEQKKSLPPLAEAHFLADLGRCYLLALQPAIALNLWKRRWKSTAIKVGSPVQEQEPLIYAFRKRKSEWGIRRSKIFTGASGGGL